MGTNFYWRHGGEHIGKRSAAGLYCYDCHLALVVGGERNAHSSTAQRLDTCPRCGKAKMEGEHYNPAYVELGFGKAPTTLTRLSGVQGASSFSWAQEPSYVQRRCKRRASRYLVKDEYGRDFIGQEFLDMLDSVCPIRFTDSIGTNFS